MDVKLSLIFKKYEVNDIELEKYQKLFGKRGGMHSDTLEQFIVKLLDLVDKNKIQQKFVIECLMLIAITKESYIDVQYWDQIFLLQNKWKINGLHDILCHYIGITQNCPSAEKIISFLNCDLYGLKEVAMKVRDYYNIGPLINYLYNNKILLSDNEIDNIVFNNYKYIDVLKQNYNINDVHEICIKLVMGTYRKNFPIIPNQYSEMIKKYMFSYCCDIKELKRCVKLYNLNICDNCINYHCNMYPDPNICIWLLENGSKPNALSVSYIVKSLINKNKPKLLKIINTIIYTVT